MYDNIKRIYRKRVGKQRRIFDASERLLGIAALDGLNQVMKYETPLALITRLSSYIPTCTEELKEAQFALLKEFLRG